jgi:alpha-beta hydrolase superfamily lysophospholipase
VRVKEDVSRPLPQGQHLLSPAEPLGVAPRAARVQRRPTMWTEHTTARADDGASLALYRLAPAGAPRGVVHLAHGMAEHMGRYAHVAARLASEGWLVQGHDHRGHGKTAPDSELGWFGPGGWDRVVRDLAGLLQEAKAAHPTLPLVLFAHSMGSFVAQQVMYEHAGALSGVILSGSAGKPDLLAQAGRLVVRAARLRAGGRGTSSLVQSLSFDAYNKAFAPNRTAFDWLSRDPAAVDAYVADPRCGFAVTLDLWQELLDHLPRLARPENRARVPSKLPVFVIAGSDDPVSKKTASLVELVEGYRAAGLTDVSHRFYPGARHEVVNETNREEVLGDLSRWLEARFPRSA